MADVPENFMKYENIKDKVISYVFNIAIDIATSKWWFLSWMSSALLIYICYVVDLYEDLFADCNIPVTISI